jgi:hypothetical protein
MKRLDPILGMLLTLLSVAGCERELQPPANGNVAPKSIPRYFLVTRDDSGTLTRDIYEIDDPVEVKKLDAWTHSHIDRRPNVQGPRGLVLLFWHPELLRFDENGQVVAADDLGDSAIIKETEHSTLKDWFHRYGKRVATVPGRKPPQQQTRIDEGVRIEYEDAAALTETGMKRGHH